MGEILVFAFTICQYDQILIYGSIPCRSCKLAVKECKNKYDLVGKVIHWELCKKLKFHLINKLYIQKLETVLENEIHKILCDKRIIQFRPKDQT